MGGGLAGLQVETKMKIKEEVRHQVSNNKGPGED